MFLVGLLKFFRRVSRLMLKLRGPANPDVASQRVVSGQAWDEFCDTLKAAGAALNFPGAPKDPFNQAEGYRYLSRLLRGGLMAFVEHADPKAPVLHRVAHETVKLGSDNPDNHYQAAAIHGDFDYRISGRRNSVKYLSFGTQEGHYGKGGGLPPTGHVEADELEIGEDGYFEVTASSRPHIKNWLPMTAETRTLIVRQTFLDRETEVPADLHIERINCADDEKLPSPLTPQQIDEGLRSAGTMVAGAAVLFAHWARGFQKHSNTLPRFDPEVSNAAGGDPNIAYYHGHWDLAADEALLIEVMPPECEHWNFQLNNYWMESLDYRYHTIHTNKHLAQYESDGSVRLVVAHEDPGLPNWIETASHTTGTMCFRWVKAKRHPQPNVRVVKVWYLNELRQRDAGR